MAGLSEPTPAEPEVAQIDLRCPADPAAAPRGTRPNVVRMAPRWPAGWLVRHLAQPCAASGSALVLLSTSAGWVQGRLAVAVDLRFRRHRRRPGRLGLGGGGLGGFDRRAAPALGQVGGGQGQAGARQQNSQCARKPDEFSSLQGHVTSPLRRRNRGPPGDPFEGQTRPRRPGVTGRATETGLAGPQPMKRTSQSDSSGT